jgi:hypothetical protein
VKILILYHFLTFRLPFKWISLYSCFNASFQFIFFVLTLFFQEYPPGVKIVPMGSRTGKPFLTTNLIVFAPENVSNESEKNSFVAYGDALIVDPGCRSEFHEEV